MTRSMTAMPTLAPDGCSATTAAVDAGATEQGTPIPVLGAQISGGLRMFEGHHKGVGARIERVWLATEALRLPARQRRPVAHQPVVHQPVAHQIDHVRASLADLRAFAAMHFVHEEKLMEDVLYPQRDRHRDRHRAFLAWMDRLEAAAEEAPHRLRTCGPATLLAGWWEAHAQGQDRALTEFLCRGGL